MPVLTRDESGKVVEAEHDEDTDLEGAVKDMREVERQQRKGLLETERENRFSIGFNEENIEPFGETEIEIEVDAEELVEELEEEKKNEQEDISFLEEDTLFVIQND